MDEGGRGVGIAELGQALEGRSIGADGGQTTLRVVATAREVGRSQALQQRAMYCAEVAQHD
jgi:hypothetical protein